MPTLDIYKIVSSIIRIRILRFKKKEEKMKKVSFILLVSLILVSVCYATIQGDYDNNNQLDLRDCIAILKIIAGIDSNDNMKDEYVVFAWNDLGDALCESYLQ